MARPVTIAAALFAMVSLAGCGANDVTDSNQIVFPDSNISFHASVQPYLALSCNETGCHDAPNSSNYGIDLTSWIGVRAPNVTTPGDTNSPLVLVLYGWGVSHQGYFKVTENQRIGIKKWVKEGAQDN